MKKILLTTILLLLIPIFAQAKRLHPERWYQERWCDARSGKMEYRLPDRTRVDCLTENYAVEFDFGSKWAESIGQVLYYSVQTGKKAGIGLIIERPSDYKYWIRLNTVIEEHNLPIEAFQVKP